jgi:hypothetical protein
MVHSEYYWISKYKSEDLIISNFRDVFTNYNLRYNSHQISSVGIVREFLTVVTGLSFISGIFLNRD